MSCTCCKVCKYCYCLRILSLICIWRVWLLFKGSVCKFGEMSERELHFEKKRKLSTPSPQLSLQSPSLQTHACALPDVWVLKRDGICDCTGVLYLLEANCSQLILTLLKHQAGSWICSGWISKMSKSPLWWHWDQTEIRRQCFFWANQARFCTLTISTFQ